MINIKEMDSESDFNYHFHEKWFFGQNKVHPKTQDEKMFSNKIIVTLIIILIIVWLLAYFV
jgi:hypothetical protein